MINQDYENREIIVVDDGSTDHTFERALEIVEGKRDARVIKAPHKGPSHARNVGAKLSSGEIIFFGECDCVYDVDYVSKAVESLAKDPGAGAVCLTGGPLKMRSTLSTNSIEIENIVQHELLRRKKIKPFYAWVYRREAFETVGGFDEKLFQAEDRDLFSRITSKGYRVLWVPGINWRHKRQETTSELVKKWFARGRMRILFSLKHKAIGNIAREILPLWGLIIGFSLIPFFWPLGVLLIILVLGGFLTKSFRVAMIAWSGIPKKRAFIGYILFIAARNLSTGLGYTVGFLNVIVWKAEGKEISYQNV